MPCKTARTRSWYATINAPTSRNLSLTCQEDDAPTDPSEARVFDSVITGLQNSYPQEKMEEISTSFCFICLLHLANERGLKIEVGGKDPRDTVDEVVDAEEERKVGDLWGLKVGTICFEARC